MIFCEEVMRPNNALNQTGASRPACADSMGLLPFGDGRSLVSHNGRPAPIASS